LQRLFIDLIIISELPQTCGEFIRLFYAQVDGRRALRVAVEDKDAFARARQFDCAA
jgi:hypothetical protein